MNIFWCGMILISMVFGAINGNIEATVNAGFEGAAGAVQTVLSFAGIMCLWNGLLEAATASGLSETVKKFMMPVMRRLFPGVEENSEAMNSITLNVTANMLGTGNGATPMGINAMRELRKNCGDKPDEAMCTFAVMNTSAFQLLPSSIIAIRSSAGSVNPFSIIIPIWICSLTALAAGILSVKILFFFLRRRNS